MQKEIWLNPNKEELTVEKAKELLGEKNTYTDEQLQELVFSIKTFVHIIIQYQKKQDKLKEEQNRKKKHKNKQETEHENQQLKLAA
ncbi:MAG: hypothetical protein KF900_09495 [Bacteroidetes bacterium]|nr:hypothetical protein [Bacteroidota bacterium]